MEIKQQEMNTRMARFTRASSMPQPTGTFIPIGELAARILATFPTHGEGR